MQRRFLRYGAKVTLKPGAKVTLKPGAKVTLKPGAKVTLKPGAKITLKPVAKVTLKPGAKVTLKPGAKITLKPGAKVSLIPGAKVSLKPGAKVTLKPGAKVTLKPGAKITLKPGAKVSLIPGAKVSLIPSDNWYNIQESEHQRKAAMKTEIFLNNLLMIPLTVLIGRWFRLLYYNVRHPDMRANSLLLCYSTDCSLGTRIAPNLPAYIQKKIVSFEHVYATYKAMDSKNMIESTGSGDYIACSSNSSNSSSNPGIASILDRLRLQSPQNLPGSVSSTQQVKEKLDVTHTLSNGQLFCRALDAGS